jgi:hypothetical protein
MKSVIAKQQGDFPMFRRIFVVGATLLLLGSTAVAQGAARACVSDIKTHCAGVEPGEGRIAACFKEHFKDLSKSCQNFVAATAAAAKACTADVKQHCADTRGRAAKIVCLASALADLSDDCKSAISQVAAARK